MLNNTKNIFDTTVVAVAMVGCSNVYDRRQSLPAPVSTINDIRDKRMVFLILI